MGLPWLTGDSEPHGTAEAAAFVDERGMTRHLRYYLYFAAVMN